MYEYELILCIAVNTFSTNKYCINGKLSREKTSANFVVLLLLFSQRNLGAWRLWRGKSEQSAKVFSPKIIFFTNLRKCSPLESFPLYGTYRDVAEHYLCSTVFCSSVFCLYFTICKLDSFYDIHKSIMKTGGM